MGSAINKFGHRGLSWATHGMMRMDVNVMKTLFAGPMEKIKEVGHVIFF